jgi:ribosome-associated protein
LLKSEVYESVKEIVELLYEKEGMDIAVIDMENSEIMVDYFIIVSGNSDTHMAALRDEVVRYLKDENIPILSYDKSSGYDWMIVDAGTFIVHIFSQEGRSFYDLESLWGEQKKIENII